MAAINSNIQRFNRNFADLYHSIRPALDVTQLSNLAKIMSPRASPSPSLVVVDVGSGTGLSTTPWAALAGRVIGVEPSEDMRRVAESTRANLTNVIYVDGTSDATGLPSASADIVQCAQSLHWMPPQQTFEEAARVLRPGGLFIAYDCDWPPICGFQAEQAYCAFTRRTEAIEAARAASPGVVKFNKDGHAKRMLDSGAFVYVRDCALHQPAQGGADELVAVALSQGSVQAALAAGSTMEELGVEELRTAANECFGGRKRSWIYTYRIRIGVV